MLPYTITNYQPPQQSTSTDQHCKVRKPRKCSQRTTRRSLKKEFEKLLVPTFASKVARNYLESTQGKSPGYSAKPKKPAKVLPDNLADFIIENESEDPVMSEEEYMECMEILTKTKNRKNQIAQICLLLGIEKDAIRKKRKSRNRAMMMGSSSCTPKRKRSKIFKTPASDANSSSESIAREQEDVQEAISEERADDLVAPVVDSEASEFKAVSETSWQEANASESKESIPTEEQFIQIPLEDDIARPATPIAVVGDNEEQSGSNPSPTVETTAVSTSDGEPVAEVQRFQSRFNSPSDAFIQTVTEPLAKTVADYACMFIGV